MTFSFFTFSVATLGSLTHLEREREARGNQLVAICHLTARCHYILHAGPLNNLVIIVLGQEQ